MTLLINHNLYYLEDPSEQIINYAAKFAKDSSRNYITAEDFLKSCSTLYPQEIEDISKCLYIKDCKKSTASTTASRSNLNTCSKTPKIEVPSILLPYITILTEKIESTKWTEQFYNTTKTINQLKAILQKKYKNSIILVGTQGVGKTTIVHALIKELSNPTCTCELKNWTFVQLHLTELLIENSSEKIEQVYQKTLLNFIKDNTKIILFIDDIENILSSNAKYGNKIIFALFNELTKQDDIRIIGTTKDFSKSIKDNAAIIKKVEFIPIRESTYSEKFQIAQVKAKELSLKHNNIKISKNIIEKCCLISDFFPTASFEPENSINLIDYCMSIAEQNGDKTIQKKHIIMAYQTYFDEFNKISKEQKRAAAYHEIGHYLILKYSSELSNEFIYGISIIPTKEESGQVITEYIDDSNTMYDIKYHIQRMAYALSGRIAEYNYTKKYSSTAHDDLEKATTIARNILLKYGLVPGFTINRSYYNEKEEKFTISKELSQKIDNKINQLLNIAYKEATNILNEHHEELESLVSKLVKQGILLKTDLENKQNN